MNETEVTPEPEPSAPATASDGQPSEALLDSAVAALGPKGPYDAVAYTRDVFATAAELCKRLPEEERIARGRKFGWRRFTCSGAQPGFPCEYITPDWHGSACLCDAGYFDWVQISGSIWGGMLTAAGAKLMAENAPGEVELEALHRKQSAAAEEQLASEGPELLAAWEEKTRDAERQYLLAVADILNIQNPERLPVERLRMVVAIARPLFCAVPTSLDFVVATVGEPPTPADAVETIPPEVKADFNAYMDFILVNGPVTIKPRIEKVVQQPRRRGR